MENAIIVNFVTLQMAAEFDRPHLRRAFAGIQRQHLVAQRGHAGAGLHEQHVGMSMVVTLELDDLGAPGEGACQTQRSHGRLGARIDEAHHLNAGHKLCN